MNTVSYQFEDHHTFTYGKARSSVSFYFYKKGRHWKYFTVGGRAAVQSGTATEDLIQDFAERKIKEMSKKS